MTTPGLSSGLMFRQEWGSDGVKEKVRRMFIPVVILASIVLMLVMVSQAPSEAQMQLMEYAKEKEIDFSLYPSSMVKLLERNPEAEKFVRAYPFRVEKHVDLSSYDDAYSVPLFLQWDEQWGYLTCNGDFVGCSGSAPMCLAMAGYYVSRGEAKFSPEKIVAYADENGYSDDVLISLGGKNLGLKVTGISREEQKIATYLRNGNPIIASTGPGDFDNYIVLTGYHNGMVTVNDPDSRVNSEKQWPFEELHGQIRKLWVIQNAE